VGHLLALHDVSLVQPQWVQDVVNSYVTNGRSQELLAQLKKKNSPNEQGYNLQQGVIRCKGKIWVVRNTTAVQTKVIAALHSSAVGATQSSMLLTRESRKCSAIRD